MNDFWLHRNAESLVRDRLAQMPAVALLGPRQIGKTTLARQLTQENNVANATNATKPAVYCDLQSRADRQKLSDPEAYFLANIGKLIVLDEVHQMPEIFPILRGQIDQRRFQGERFGHFLILGSASLSLLRQSSESLAGRLTTVELNGISPAEFLAPTAQTDTETDTNKLNQLWLRGGYPDSLLAMSNEASTLWRQSFIQSYLERDIPLFGGPISPHKLERLWTMLAHCHGGLVNINQLAGSLDLRWRQTEHFTDLLTDLLLLRQLKPWFVNNGKRLTKSPKLYLRDTGLLHTLLGLHDLDALLSHPIAGLSWEGFVIEHLVSRLPSGITPYFYRTQAGAEIDLVIEMSAGKLWAIEIKKSSAPTLTKGFKLACDDLQPARKILVHSGSQSFPMANGVEALTITDAINAFETSPLN